MKWRLAISTAGSLYGTKSRDREGISDTGRSREHRRAALAAQVSIGKLGLIEPTRAVLSQSAARLTARW